MLSISEMSVFKVYPVVFLSDFDCFIPFTTTLMQLAQEIISAARLVKLFSIVDHIELYCNHRKSCV